MALRIPANLTMDCKKAIGTYEPFSGHFFFLWPQLLSLPKEMRSYQSLKLHCMASWRCACQQDLHYFVAVVYNLTLLSDLSHLGTCSWNPRSGTLSTAMMVKSRSDWFFWPWTLRIKVAWGAKSGRIHPRSQPCATLDLCVYEIPRLTIRLFELYFLLDLEGASESTKQFIKEKGIDVTEAQFNVAYDHWTAGNVPIFFLYLRKRSQENFLTWRLSHVDEVLRAILPEELVGEAPSSFTTVGHIAHMNLKDEYLPWKTLIGEIILDKNPNLRTVVNKMDSIDTTFRFFKMEVLAGDDDMIAEVVCIFDPFLRVVWRSKVVAFIF